MTTEPGRAFRRTIHETIKRVTDDLERGFHFNTAISAVMELVNALYTFEPATAEQMAPLASAPAAPQLTLRDGMVRAERAGLLREAVETVLLLLGPFCPHVTEELWSQLGHAESLLQQPWPVPDPAALARREVTVVVQVDGKVRSRLTVEVDTGDERVRQLALADEKVRPWLNDRALERVVVVANRLVNIVTRR